MFLPGVAVNRASAAYRGEGKTDAKDTAVIADQCRMRRDLRELHIVDGDIAELRMLTAHRADLVADRTRAINRLPGPSCWVSSLLSSGFSTSPTRARWSSSAATRLLPCSGPRACRGSSGGSGNARCAAPASSPPQLSEPPSRSRARCPARQPLPISSADSPPPSLQSGAG